MLSSDIAEIAGWLADAVPKLAGKPPSRLTARQTAREQTRQGLGVTAELAMTFPDGLVSHSRISNMEEPRCRLFAVRRRDASNDSLNLGMMVVECLARGWAQLPP